MKVDRDEHRFRSTPGSGKNPRRLHLHPLVIAPEYLVDDTSVGPELVLTFEPEARPAEPASIRQTVLRAAVITFFVVLAAACGVAIG